MDNCFLIVNKIAKNKAKDHISLSYDERFLRRKKLVSDNGFEFLVNLPETKSLSENLNKASSRLNIDILNIYMSEIIDAKEDNEIWESFIKNISGYKNIIFLSQTSVTKGINLIGESHDLSSLENNFYSVGEKTSAH